MRFSLIKKNKPFQKNYMKVGVKKLLRAGMVPARTLGAHAVGERLKLRRQMSAVAGKKSTTSLSLFMDAFGLPRLGQKGSGLENGTLNKEKLG